MSVNFPAIAPTSRSFVPPKWQSTKIKSQSGVSTTRIWGSKPSDGQLSLTFNNISTDVGALILSAYNEAKGAGDNLLLPSEVFAGESEIMMQWINSNINEMGYKWFFDNENPPSMDAVAPGICSMRVNLLAELRLS